MSLLRRDDFFKSSLDDPFFENWESDLKDFRHGFFKNSLLAASPAVANTTLDHGAAPRALRRQKSWYDRELEAASSDGDFTVNKSFAKNEGGADVTGSLKAGRRTEESADGRDKAQYEKSEKEMTAAAVSADGKSSSIAAERSTAEAAKTSSKYVSPDGSSAMAAASSSSSSSFASKSESATSSGDLAATGARSKMAASSSSSSKSASFSSSSSSSSSSAFKKNSMLDGTDISSLTAGMSALPGLTAMPALPEMPAMSGLSTMPALRGMSPMSAASSAMSSNSKSSKSSSMSSQKESASALSSKSAVKSSLAKESLSDVSLGSSSKFLAGDSAPPSRSPPSYAESVVDDEEDCKVYYPISYEEIGRQDSIPVSQSFFTIIDGKKRILKLQFYVGRGYDAKNVRVNCVGKKLMVSCIQGEMTYSKDVNLPEEVDNTMISSLLSKDGVLTVQCILSDKTNSVATLHGPVIKDEEGNKVIQLQYDVQAFDPKDVKVVLQGDMLRIHAVREEHSASVCVKKELKRDFALPAAADKDSLLYKVEDGILSVKIKVKETVYQRALSEEGCAGNKIHLEFDVGDFEPEDVQVQLGGGTLSVAGRRRAKFEKEAQVLDFSRECVVPSWVDSDSLRSYLTPAGKLTIEIPMEKTVRSELHFNVNQ